MGPSRRGMVARAVESLAHYLLWFVTCGLGIVDLLALRRTVLEVHVALGGDQWTIRPVNQLVMFVGAVLWVVLAYVSEARYRQAAASSPGRFLKLFAWIAGAQLGFLAVSAAIVLLLMR